MASGDFVVYKELTSGAQRYKEVDEKLIQILRGKKYCNFKRENFNKKNTYAMIKTLENRTKHDQVHKIKILGFFDTQALAKEAVENKVFKNQPQAIAETEWLRDFKVVEESEEDKERRKKIQSIQSADNFEILEESTSTKKRSSTSNPKPSSPNKKRKHGFISPLCVSHSESSPPENGPEHQRSDGQENSQASCSGGECFDGKGGEAPEHPRLDVQESSQALDTTKTRGNGQVLILDHLPEPESLVISCSPNPLAAALDFASHPLSELNLQQDNNCTCQVAQKLTEMSTKIDELFNLIQNLQPQTGNGQTSVKISSIPRNAVSPSLAPPVSLPEGMIYVGASRAVPETSIQMIIDRDEVYQTKIDLLVDAIYGTEESVNFYLQPGPERTLFPPETVLAISNLLLCGKRHIKEAEKEPTPAFVRLKLTKILEKKRPSTSKPKKNVTFNSY